MTQTAPAYGTPPALNGYQPHRPLIQGLCGLVHGEQKNGKSSWADSGSRPGAFTWPTLCMDVEHAAYWTPSRKTLWEPSRETVPVANGSWDTCVVNVRDIGTMHQVAQVLQSGQHPFNSISVDSVPSIVQQVMMAQAGLNKMQRDDWGILLRQLTKVFNDYKGLLTHPTRPVWAVTFVCSTHRDFKTGKMRPWLAGQAADLLPYMPDYEGWVYIAPDGTHRMWSGPSREYETGNRLWGRLPWDMQLGYPGLVEGWTLETAVQHVIATQQQG